MPQSKIEDVRRLAECLDKLPPVGEHRAVIFDTAPEKLIDCVLSLNRRYDGFVVPRLTKFRRKYSQVTTLTGLKQTVITAGGSVEFYSTDLDYEYPVAAEMFDDVLSYLLDEMPNYPGVTDLDRLLAWAVSAKIVGYKEVKIHGFGIGGWQYLRMLFGADTCKPDIAVKGFVKECLGRRYLSGINVVQLMEAAAPLVPQLRLFDRPVREADRRIWNRYNSGGD